MDSIPWRVQLGIVGAGYAAVSLLTALLLFSRHMQYVKNSADAAAAGGMWAGGDLILAIFIGCLFCVPTFLLVLVIRKSLLLLWATGQGNSFFGWFSFYRVLASPLFIIGFVVSWLLGRFARAKRLLLYALGIEAGALVIGIAIFFALIATRH
jgi:hypothetical protein